MIKDIQFVGSFQNIGQCPKRILPEYAFIGRSNVGKSSLINMVTDRKALARVSNTPGKTQLINYFLINDAWYLVDLPGYGYAKSSKTKRRQWETMIKNYFIHRESLVCIFELIDSRHELQKIDLEFINGLGDMKLPFAIIFTKTDKLKKTQKNANIEQIKEELMLHWHSLPECFISSAKTKEGREEILAYIADLNKKLGT